LTDAAKRLAVPVPALRLRGVAGAGAAGLLLHSSVLPRASHGYADTVDAASSWSVSFWAWIRDGPSGDFRSLLHKGTVGDDNRTPSAWLMPNDMRLAIRVSTSAEANLGTESVRELPLQRWAHIAFVFTNSSDGSAFELTLYVDGALDCSLKFRSAVLANDGPLRLGRDIWERGTRMLVSEVKVFAQALTESAVLLDYRAGLQLHSSKFHKSILENAHSPAALTYEPQVLRLFDGLHRATEVVARWRPASVSQNATAAADTAFSLLENCNEDYITAMEVCWGFPSHLVYAVDCSCEHSYQHRLAFSVHVFVSS
jgi:hypothetical protein